MSVEHVRSILALAFAMLGASAALPKSVQASLEATSALKHCASILAAAERLACYDALAARAGVSTTAPAESFGLRAAPTAPRVAISSVAARVNRIAVSRNGQPLLVLDNNQSWEIDSADELLAPGDAITISRASLGSFLLRTPSGRTHRTVRIR